MTEGRFRPIRGSLVVATACGFLLVVYLIVASGAADVVHSLHVIGWWLLPITLFHLIPLLASALSWRELLPPTTRPDVTTVVWICWICESINSLLPVASIGGISPVCGCRSCAACLAYRRSQPWSWTLPLGRPRS